jgi:hypothetical protein
MTPHKPPRLAHALLKWIGCHNDPLVGDLEEQFQNGRSRRWYWAQVIGIAISRSIHDLRYAAGVILASVMVATGVSVGWWGIRFAVPVLLGIAITSWKLWRLHRTSLAILYGTSIAVVFPHWMMTETLSNGDRVFWAIARILGGYGVVGVLLVPFLILRLGRSGPLADPPIDLSLSR